MELSIKCHNQTIMTELIRWTSSPNLVFDVEKATTQLHSADLKKPPASKKGILLLSAGQDRLIQIVGQGGLKLKLAELNDYYVDCSPNPKQEENTDNLPIYQVGKLSSHPIMVELEINCKKLVMEIDTGAAVSVISRDKYKLFSDTSLNPSTVRLKTYTGKPMTVAGELDVEVKYGSQVCILSLTVVEGLGPSLLGHDWLCHLTLDWKKNWASNLRHGSHPRRSTKMCLLQA